MVRLTDRPDMTLDVYRGRKTTNQQKSTTFREMSRTVNLASPLMISFILETISLRDADFGQPDFGVILMDSTPDSVFFHRRTMS